MEQDEDSGYPNFDNAYPSSASNTSADPGAIAASWNPALRHSNAESAPAPEESDDEFFDRYPGATPKKQPPSSMPDLEGDTPVRRQSISVQHVVDIRQEDATPEMLERVPSHHVEVQGPGGNHTWEGEADEDEDDEGRIFEPDDEAPEQEVALEERMPEGMEGGRQDTAEDVEISPSDHYEHQGEVTAMEEAIERSAAAPLMQDEEDLPTPGFVSREPSMAIPSRDSTLGFDGAPAPRQPRDKAPLAAPQLDRSFTSNFSDSPIEARSQAQGQSGSIPDDWPSMGDDRTFGELLDNASTSMTGERAAFEQTAARGSRQIFSPDIEPPTQTQQGALEQVAAHESEQMSSPDTKPASLEQAAAQESQQIASPDTDLLPEEEGEIKEEDLAAAWGAAIDDDELLEETPTDADLDPSKFFGEDEEGFLEDEPESFVQQQQQRSAAPAAQQYRPQQPQAPQQQSQFGPGSPQLFSQAHGRSAGTPSTGLDDIYNTSGALQPQQQSQNMQPQRPNLQQAQSFADKAKGGYQSPYDLPMEVVKPRRRPQPPQQHSSQAPLPGQAPVPRQAGAPQAPPRSSSMSSNATAPVMTGPLPVGTTPVSGPPRPRTGGSGSSMSPPQSSHSGGSGAALAAAAKSTPKTASGFFEDLPMSTKHRARPAYTPGPASVGTPPIGGPMGMPTPPIGGPQHPPRSSSGSSYVPQAPQQSSTPSMYGGGLGLQKPAQLPLLPEQSPPAPQQQAQGPPPSSRYSPGSQQAQTGHLPTPPASQNRFSPAPPSTAQPPLARSRYSPAPSSQPAQVKPRQPSVPANTSAGAQHFRPFAPRTSSPLAAMQTDKPRPPLPPEATRGLPPSSPPKANGVQQTMSPESRPASKYAPSEAPTMSAPPMTFAAPQRPRTQSPDATMKGPRAVTQSAMVRPNSSAGMPSVPQPAQRPVLPHRRQFSRELTFAVPQDERSLDPLERWKGHPVFKWSASGTILSTFPKQTPFYAAGQGIPSVKCTPGAIAVQDASVFMPMEDRNAKFAGPLTARSKRQKKDVVAWLGGKIEDLERAAEGAMLDFSMVVSMRKRVEEKVILWKIVKIFVEHEGVLEGNPKIEEEVRRVLLPNLAQMAQVVDLQSPASAAVMPDPVDKQVLFQIRQALLEGQRERAVWLAEEKKLWGHAMLLASTMGPETWKQIIQAFVRSQVKSVGSDARSTAALYQVFAGNADECADELVPPHARAGFQMISKADGSVAGNPLEGLDQWRETLGLITSNRTASDGQSLLALGKLLASYGRVEAAHTCFLFARSLVKHSGQDDAEAHFVLLGANHQSAEETVGNDLDSILLTEVYEYASSLSAPSTAVSYIPHLQAFKLVHAQELAAYGLKTQAQTYCDHITSAYTSTTRPSPYYHPAFTQAVADLGAFLSQTPHDGKAGSFFSKPAMNKVSSGAASWFSKFVAGEDDQESTGSGPDGAGSDDMAGPFGRVNGESPSISRTASVTDLYNPPMGGMPIPGMANAGTPQSFAPSSAPSRYAPGAGVKYGPAQPYSHLGMPAAEPQRPSSSRYAPAPSNLGVPRQEVTRRGSDNSVPSYAPSSRRGSGQDTSSQGSYEPRPILADESSAYSYSPAFNSPLVQAQQAPAVQEPEDAFGGPNGMGQPLDAGEGGGLDAETGSGYMPPSAGYEPPSYGYQPYDPDPDSPEEARPKKAFGDDEDDDAIAKQAAALKKAQADREADDAFRKAAEADAAREKDKGEQKKGWFGGWLGGKKDDNLSQGPVRAKLGEANSFYYDENLKKWVNKKAGPEAATQVVATPPPPRGPASRVASSTAMGPPSGPPSRASSGTGAAVRPPTSGSGPAFSGPPSGPPSRTGTPASNPASEPGNLAAPGVNGDSASGPPLAPPPPLRPGSSLSTASSIDDLMGPAGTRKGGTVKGKKKGGRYVDVMAK